MSSILSLRSLPEGIVTFLFTDVEGSPLLATALGDAAWRELLETPRRLLRRAFATYGGVELGTQGDSFFVVFSRASDGLQSRRAQEEGAHHPLSSAQGGMSGVTGYQLLRGHHCVMM